VVLIGATPAGAQAWKRLDGLSVEDAPAVAAFPANRLYLAAGDVGGDLLVTSTFDAGQWGPPRSVAKLPPGGLATETTPAFLSDGKLLWLFARGRGGDIYRIATDGQRWGAWSPLFLDRAATGPFSVAFTRPASDVPSPVSEPVTLHVAFQSLGDTIEYRRIDVSTNRSIGSRRWDGAREVRLASDGQGTLGAAIRYARSVRVEATSRNARGAWAWRDLGARGAFGDAGLVFDMSNLVFYDGAFQIAYGISSSDNPEFGGGYEFALRHARFRPSSADDGMVRQIASFTPAAAGVVQASLAVYRNRLVAAYRDEKSFVRWARWDTADPVRPWVGGASGGIIGVSGGSYPDKTSARPVLIPFNGRSPNKDWRQAGWGDDLLAVRKGFDGFDETTLFAANFSRETARQEVGRQMALFEGYDPGTCALAREPTVRVNLSSENRPVLTELGASFAILPDRMSGSIFRKIAEEGACGKGSPYFQPPCTNVKLPVVLTCGEIFVNTWSSAWVPMDSDWARLYEELGHILAGGLGFHDSKSLPIDADAARTGIPLSELVRGAGLFGSESGRCPAGSGRCVGFTDRTYEVFGSPTRQHHFLYLLIDYVLKGSVVRKWAADDLAGRNTTGLVFSWQASLLQQKYDWIRKNLYQGVEFSRDGAPATKF
jgi:hypothetical protein